MANVLAITFEGGLDDTHHKRSLPSNTGVKCSDLDLRFGRFQPRPDLSPFTLNGVNLTAQSSVQLCFSCYSANGEQLLFLATGDGKLKVLRGVAFETVNSGGSPATFPSFTSSDNVVDRKSGIAVELQTTEPMEWARFGDTVYICNAGAATGGDYDWSTLKLDLQDLKAELMTEEDWPKSRHIENYLSYAVLGDLSTEGQRTILSTDLPLVGDNAVTWAADNWDEPQTDPDDRVMRLIYNGQYLLAFYKRCLYRYVGAPTHWKANRLLDIGTLAPESVEFLNGNVYFLGSDGIPRRTNGQEMVAEKVGAFDYQGKMKHVDGRSPIETGLRGYQLGSALASAATATFRWDSKQDFDGGCVWQDPGDPTSEDGYDTNSEFVLPSSELSEVGGVHPEKTFACSETCDVSKWDAAIPTESQLETGARDRWQSFRLAALSEGGVAAVRYSHLAHSVIARLKFSSVGPHNLHARLCYHTSDTAGSLSETLIKKVDLSYSATNVGGEEYVEFEFGDVRIEDNTSTLPTGVYGNAKYRVVISRDDGGDEVIWRYYDHQSSPIDTYPRGRAGGTGHQDHDDYQFSYKAWRYKRTVSNQDLSTWVWARLSPSSYVQRSGRTWRDVTFKIHDTDHSFATVYLTSRTTDPLVYDDLKEVKSSGANVNALFGTPPDNLRWVVRFKQDYGWGGDHAALESIALSLTSATIAGDPAAIAWDGRYCLSLKRTGSAQRDIYVWDRDAWSRWENVGFDHATIMDDAMNRKRLVTLDSVAAVVVGAITLKTVCTFFAEAIRTGWRSVSPKFQTGVLPLAGLQVASPYELTTVYNEAVGAVAGAWLSLRHRLDNSGWIDDEILLEGPLSPDPFPPRTRRESLPNDEGRHIELLVGEDPLNPNAVQNPGIEVDVFYIDSDVLGPRRGYHTGA